MGKGSQERIKGQDKQKQIIKDIQNVIKKWPKYTLEQKYKAIEQIPGGTAFLERQYEKHFEEQLKHPIDFGMSVVEAWRKRISLPFNLSERLENKSKPFPSKEEKEKFMKAKVEFVSEVLKFEEIQKKVEKEFLLLQKKNGKKIKPAEVNEKRKDLPPTKFEEVKKLLYIPIDYNFYEIAPYIIPYRLSETSLVHKEILKDNSLALKYKIESRGKSIVFNFLIPPEVLGKIKEKDIPTVGVNMRRSLYAALAFAFVQNTTSPNFKRSELFRAIGEDPRKIRKLYSDLENALLTWAYGTYTIIIGDKILEVGHIVNQVKLPKRRGDKTLVQFNPEIVKPLFRSEMDTGNRKYISYPTDLLKVKPKEMKLHIRNFCESLLKKQGMGRKVYPKYVKKILVQDFGISSKKLRKLSNTQIRNILMEGIEEAKERGFLEDCKVTEESQKKALYNIRKWKMKLIVSSRPENDS